MSTESCPSLNGIVGNHERLKDELLEMGIFDSRLSTDFINKCQASIILENAPPETVVQLLRIALTILNHEHNCD
jgi:glucosamine 6-phosphate synthetase-like amidotransferase/phosphosugar isomerase protein